MNVDDDEMVQICPGGLAPQFGDMRTAVLAREKSSSFELQSMLLVEENHVRTRSNVSEGTCSTRTRTKEEDVDKRQADSAKNKADEVRPTKTTPNFGRNMVSRKYNRDT